MKAPDFGESIRGIRTDQGRTLRDVAAAAGITHSGLSRIELEGRDPSLGTLRGLAKALGVRIVIDGYRVDIQDVTT